MTNDGRPASGAPTPTGAVPAQSGVVTADKHGLVTLPQITIAKAKGRVIIIAAP